MPTSVSVGVSLKMYFGHADARRWFERVAELAVTHPAVIDGRVECFVIPTYVQLLPAIEAFRGTRVVVGAQDVATEDAGAYTGEVSAAELAEVGVRLAEVGHAERRRFFGETEDVVAGKTAAALRNGLTPVLCLGEAERLEATDAAAEVVRQLHAALHGAPAGRVIVAYEPVWAIGAPEPAPVGHIAIVASALRDAVDALDGRHDSTVIYGGSAGPGLLTQLGDAVDGLFLGRFAHDPAALADVLDEAAALAARREEVRA
ncbi:triosephosphate isomerase [Agromyces sp. ISL-38]|uniref:triose-phosphate isomerase family protein n=1 Tax=Agromyces sp. ISL-38 TaxID=2819107 RepID=UPI001BE525B0|nr:triose-phosphate isomerase family protein [Agromyces sp. ISL-38]MBT2500130.1 triosephosphate isomerase [Agromyces sp. ISL-38]MBT2516797.1 triosephosphate isomerase [Streptomyces sp. ISL-90]